MLWKTIKDILQVTGCNIVEIGQQIFQQINRYMATPSRGVAGSMTSCTSFVTVGNEVAKDKEGGEISTELTTDENNGLSGKSKGKPSKKC